MISDEDRADLGDLAMRAIDAMIECYGDDATLVAGCLVFEVAVGEPGNEDCLYHGNYESLTRSSSPNHIGGLLHSTAMHILSPATDEDT